MSQTQAPTVPQSTIQWTLASALKAYQSRQKFTTAQAANGQRVILRLTGNGNIIDVIDGQGNHVVSNQGEMLQKKIFNTVCNSAVAVRNERNQEILRAGLKAEKAGNSEEAAKHYNDYLNKTQVSVSVLAGTSNFDKIQDGDQIKGRVQKITTAKGSILTLDPKSLSIVAPGYGDEP